MLEARAFCCCLDLISLSSSNASVRVFWLRLAAAAKMSINDKPHGFEVEDRGRGGKVKRHFKRFWWLHLIIFIAILLLIVLLM